MTPEMAEHYKSETNRLRMLRLRERIAMQSDEFIEAFAIRAAKGNNGGEWATHYTEEQKESWRQLVRDLVQAMLHAEEPLP